MFENYKVYEIEYGGKKMTFETGKMCCLSNASVGHRLLPPVGGL